MTPYYHKKPHLQGYQPTRLPETNNQVIYSNNDEKQFSIYLHILWNTHKAICLMIQSLNKPIYTIGP